MAMDSMVLSTMGLGLNPVHTVTANCKKTQMSVQLGELEPTIGLRPLFRFSNSSPFSCLLCDTSGDKLQPGWISPGQSS